MFIDGGSKYLKVFFVRIKRDRMIDNILLNAFEA